MSGTNYTSLPAAGPILGTDSILIYQPENSGAPFATTPVSGLSSAIIPAPALTSTYTTSGVIAVTDKLAKLNSSGTLAMTLANPTVASVIYIYNISTGTHSVTFANAMGQTNFVVSMAGTGVGGSALMAVYVPTDGTWIIF